MRAFLPDPAGGKAHTLAGMKRVFRLLDAIRRPAAGVLATAMAALALPAGATPAWQGGSDRIAIVRTFAEQEAAREQPAYRAQIEVGTLNPYLRLAPCNQVEPFLYPGARLWGRGFVGLRCMEAGRAWSVSVPVVVHYFGPALIATQPIPVLTPITAAQVQRTEVDLTRDPGGVATRLSQVLDHTLQLPVAAGQAIPLSALQVVPAVRQGDAVTIVGRGTGFSITTDGIALGAAGPGDPVQVKTESGRIVTGTAERGRVVELRF